VTIESELQRIGDLLEKLLASESKSSSTPTVKKTRASKEASPSTSAPETTPSTSEVAGSPTTASAAEPAATNGAPQPSKEEVRAALIALQTRDGGKEARPAAILAKYSPSGTMGKLAESDYAKVIAECKSA